MRAPPDEYPGQTTLSDELELPGSAAEAPPIAQIVAREGAW